MQKISAFNQNNQTLEIEIIRYFKKNDKKYLVFTLGETDDQGYVKVYVSKILGINETLAAYDIIDEIEWANVREIVKKIIKANREGTFLEIEDLSTELLNNIKINGQQGFKLIHSSIELLGSNINAVKDEIDDKIGPISESSVIQIHPIDEQEEQIDMQEIQESVQPELPQTDLMYLEKYQEIIEENAMLKAKLTAIKALIDEEIE